MGVNLGSRGCLRFFCLINLQRGISTGGGGATRGQSRRRVTITECGWL